MRHPRSLRIVVAMPLLAAVAGCFLLDRSSEFEDGVIGGRGVRAIDGQRTGASFARAEAIGSAQVRVADVDGRFALAGLPPGRFDLRVHDDVDGDGWANRSLTMSGTMPPAQEGRPRFVSLGDVTLQGTFGLRGSARQQEGADVVVVPADRVARVYALRGACNAGGLDVSGAPCAPGSDVATRVELGSDGEAAADGEGRWQLTAIPEGTVEVVALLHAVNGDGSLGAVVDLQGPEVVVGDAEDDGDTLIDDNGPDFVFDGTAVLLTSVQLVFSEPVQAGAFAVLAPPGTPIGSCATANTTPAPARVEPIAGGADDTVIADLPVGPYDVVVCSGDRRGSLLTRPVALPSVTPAIWRVLLLPGDACPDGVDDRDCDDDGVRGFPLSRLASFSQPCAASCFPAGRDSLGAAVAERVCDVDEGTFDCDDDADGQPDITEAPPCVGLGRGTDLDGDGLCSVSDPFPHCAENTAAACVAGAEELTPTLFSDEEPPPPPDRPGNVSVVAGITFSAAGVAVPVRLGVGSGFAVIGALDAVDGGALADEIPVLQVNGDGAVTVVRGSLWQRVGEPNVAVLPRADVAAAVGDAFADRFAGGSAAACAVEADPCPAADARVRVFAEVFTLVEDVAGGGGRVVLNTPSFGRASLGRARSRAALTSASGGTVIVGGVGCPAAATPDVDGSVLCEPATLEPLASVEVDFGTADDLSVARADAQATSLFDEATSSGFVIVVGGDTASGVDPPAPSAVVDVLRVGDGTLTREPAGTIVPNLADARSRHSLSLVQRLSGEPIYVVAGGRGPGASSYEVFVPGAAAWVRGTLLTPRAEHGAAVLPDGRVLLVGGVNPVTGTALTSTEIIDPRAPAGSSSVAAEPLLGPRRQPVVINSETGAVIVLGGFDTDNAPRVDAERFDVFRVRGVIDTAAFADVVGCSVSAVDNAGLTVAMQCETPPAGLGVTDLDAATPEAILVDVRTGALFCASCAGGEARGILPGSVELANDGVHLLFTSTATFGFDAASDTNGIADAWVLARSGGLSSFQRVLSTAQGLAVGVSTSPRPGLVAATGGSVAPSIGWVNGQGVIQLSSPFGSVADVITFGEPTMLPPYGAALHIGLVNGFLSRVALLANAGEGAATTVFVLTADPGVTGGNEVLAQAISTGVAAEPAISADGRFVAFAQFDGTATDIIRVELNDLEQVVGTQNLTAALPDPCIVGSTCGAPAVDDSGDVIWSTDAGEVVVGRVVGRVVSHQSLATAEARLPFISPNGRHATFASTSAAFDGDPSSDDGAERVILAAAEGEGEGEGEVELAPDCIALATNLEASGSMVDPVVVDGAAYFATTAELARFDADLVGRNELIGPDATNVYTRSAAAGARIFLGGTDRSSQPVVVVDVFQGEVSGSTFSFAANHGPWLTGGGGLGTEFPGVIATDIARVYVEARPAGGVLVFDQAGVPTSAIAAGSMGTVEDMVVVGGRLFVAQGSAVQSWDVTGLSPRFDSQDAANGVPRRLAPGPGTEVWATFTSPPSVVRYDATTFPASTTFPLAGTEAAAGIVVDGSQVIVGRTAAAQSFLEVYDFDGTALRLLDRLAVAREPEHLALFAATAGRLVVAGVAADRSGGGAAYDLDACVLP